MAGARGHPILIESEAGIGKSPLLQELLTMVEARGASRAVISAPGAV